ncbi:hypothetical protein V8C86DRAFT_3157200 [Haematococcus lacustris]
MQCLGPKPTSEQVLRANASTVAWGYFWKHREPQLYVRLLVQSGETFTIEMASHHNGDMYDWMIKGDPALEDIFRFDYKTQTISMRGRSGVSDGAHVMTGPVYICGAEPGDTLKIEILDMKPRKNPVTGKSYAANGIADWGWQKRIVGNRHVDSTFIYEIIMDADGYGMWAEPRLYFKWKDEAGKPLVKVPCWPTNGTLLGAHNKSMNWSNPFPGMYTVTGYNYTCVNGSVTLGDVGAIVPHPLPTDDYSVSGKWRLPISPHIGTLGLAPDVEDTPQQANQPFALRTPEPGGNLDHKRLSMGAEFSCLWKWRVACSAVANAEYSGTALESNFNARLRVTVLKANDSTISPLYKNLITPLLENSNEWCFHGFTVNDYLHDPQTATGQVGSWNTLLPALSTNTYQANHGDVSGHVLQLMNNTAVVATSGLMKLGFTRDQASSILTFACDWEVTQVVNINMGNHMCCLKYILPVAEGQGSTFVPSVFPGSSRPLKMSNNKFFQPYR